MRWPLMAIKIFPGIFECFVQNSDSLWVKGIRDTISSHFRNRIGRRVLGATDTANSPRKCNKIEREALYICAVKVPELLAKVYLEFA